jgi:hypothetical protein
MPTFSWYPHKPVGPLPLPFLVPHRAARVDLLRSPQMLAAGLPPVAPRRQDSHDWTPLSLSRRTRPCALPGALYIVRASHARLAVVTTVPRGIPPSNSFRARTQDPPRWHHLITLAPHISDRASVPSGEKTLPDLDHISFAWRPLLVFIPLPGVPSYVSLSITPWIFC